jgi:hypothetical protein
MDEVYSMVDFSIGGGWMGERLGGLTTVPSFHRWCGVYHRTSSGGGCGAWW